jgi:hypothetical protein
MEHLPRATATYDVAPVGWDQAKLWLEESGVISAVRTTEMITAIKAGMDVEVAPSPSKVAIRPGDEALLITLSFSVLPAWAEQNIAPLPEDWRCTLLRVQARSELQPSNTLAAAIGEEVADEPVGDSLRSSQARRHDAWGRRQYGDVLFTSEEPATGKDDLRLLTTRNAETLPYSEGTCDCDSHPVTDATCASSDDTSGAQPAVTGSAGAGSAGMWGGTRQ